MDLKQFNDVKMPSRMKMEEYKSSVIDSICKEPFIQEMINSNPSLYTIDFINAHILDFIQIMESNGCCNKCKGYLTCPKEVKGYQATIEFNEESNEYCLTNKICKFFNEIYAIVKGYNYHDFPSDWYFTGLKMVERNKSTDPAIVLLHKKYKDFKTDNKGLYMYGGSGTGKSFIAVAYANSLIRNYDCKVNYVNFRIFLSDLRNNLKDKDYIEEQLSELKDCEVLFIDDLGAEKPSDWSMQDILYEILSYRQLRSKKTYITSLYSLNDLGVEYGHVYSGSNLKVSRLISCIRSLCDELELKDIKVDYKK